MPIVIPATTLTDFEGSTFGQTLALLQAELDISIYTGGAGSVEIVFGPNLQALVAAQGSSVPSAQDLYPFEVAGFRELVNDVHLSRLFAEWSTAFGGSLLLRAVLEEEGTEIRGGLDFDLKHLELQLYLVPSLDAAGTVQWAVELDLEIDGSALLDSFRDRIKDEILGSGIASLIGDSLGALVGEINFLLGLDTQLGPTGALSFGSISITPDQAVFGDVPPNGRRVDVWFDAVEVHDDSDWPGQGELSFRPTIQGIATDYSQEYSAASGSLPCSLVDTLFHRAVMVPEDTPLTLRFEARDRETIGRDQTLGTVDAEIAFDTLTRAQALKLGLDRGDYTLHLRVLPADAAASEGSRRLAVTLTEVQVLRDQDTFGKGEVQFFATVNGTPTPVSAEVKAAGAQDPDIEPRDAAGRALAVELVLPADETLDVRVVGWDNDPSQRDDMGEARLSASIDDALDGSPHELEAATGDFVATVTVVDLDAPPPGEVDPAIPARAASRVRTCPRSRAPWSSRAWTSSATATPSALATSSSLRRCRAGPSAAASRSRSAATARCRSSAPAGGPTWRCPRRGRWRSACRSPTSTAALTTPSRTTMTTWAPPAPASAPRATTAWARTRSRSPRATSRHGFACWTRPRRWARWPATCGWRRS